MAACVGFSFDYHSRKGHDNMPDRRASEEQRVIRNFFRRGQRQPALPPRPERPLFLVGDVHGRLDLLDQLLSQILPQIDAMAEAVPALVFLGDLIDRGPDGAGVLVRVIELARSRAHPVVCLRGNHEQMFLDVLTGTAAPGKWLSHGGDATIAAFGMAGQPADDDDFRRQLSALARVRLGVDPAAWLDGLPCWFASGDVLAVHAAGDHDRPITHQPRREMIWGRPGFATRPLPGPGWVVHGHWISRPATMSGHRIGVDTGAYATGELSCVVLASGQAPYFETTVSAGADQPGRGEG